jgi:hypothetical protein
MSVMALAGEAAGVTSGAGVSGPDSVDKVCADSLAGALFSLGDVSCVEALG